MFTGIIKGVAKVTSISAGSGGGKLVVDAGDLVADPEIGESIALDGVCLTLTEYRGTNLSFDISAETIKRTAFTNASPGTKLNLERAMELGGRLGGHLVSGHIDEVGHVTNIKKMLTGSEISIGGVSTKYAIEKGSIAINGISLTIAEVSQNGITIAVIPHTLKNTTLQGLTVGRLVNLEYDMIGKYVESFVKTDNKGLDENFLRKHGF